MESDPEPEPNTKGEARRKQILIAILHYFESHNRFPTVQDVKEMTGIRSFNTLTRQLKILKQKGKIEWEHISPVVKLVNDTEIAKDV